MENQDRAPQIGPAEPSAGWVVSPAFDLLFFANLGWLLLLVPGFASPHDTAIDFWQVYFLTLPHRWITLVLVLTDPDRREGHARKQVAVAALAGALVVGTSLGSGAFLCLAMVDFIWNAWHFASQHAGVLRIYTKKVGGGVPWLERWGVRLFVTYTALRAAGWTTGWLEPGTDGADALMALDWLVLLAPVGLVATNLGGLRRECVGKLAYLLSVCGLYSGFLLSLHYGLGTLTVAFAAAGSMFHAVEYLAVVSHYASRRTEVTSAGPFRHLARYWLMFLGAYMLTLGATGLWMSHPDSGFSGLWQGLNLWASFVHYAFDGMIWKLRRPETATALGVGRASGGGR